jgi:iron complex outermembrane recepter protein
MTLVLQRRDLRRHDSSRQSGGLRPLFGRFRSAAVSVLCALALLSAAGRGAAAQTTGTVTGVVTSREAAAPLEGVRVAIDGTAIGTVTDARGAFRIAGVPAGEVVVSAEVIGHEVVRRTVTVRAGATVEVELSLDVAAVPLGGMVVTASGEAERKAETAATIGVVGGEEIRETRPAHPSEIMNRIAGVWVNVTGGEGHMTSIRQPKTTNPVYLYLENGVPTRSTGFFNHNALYEINVPQAERIEVVKGPASALYGSDAIGGVVNVVTPLPREEGVDASAEGGANGFARLLASGTMLGARDGVRAELNLTRTDGWRSGTAYDRQTGTLHWDRDLSATSKLRTIASFSRIDQSTAGSSAISFDDYQAAPTINYTPISYRKVEAFRLSSAWDRLAGSTLFSVTPFARWNRMEMLPNWSLTYDPAISETGHASVGALLKARHDFGPMRARIIAGADLDYSPGSHFERAVSPTRDGKIFRSYTEGDPLYDYDVTFWAVSPYVQAEASPVDRVRVTAGLRFDVLGYDYDNTLGALATGQHRRPASTAVDYTHASPKLGVTVDIAPWLNTFAAYGHGFRAPSEGQLFRQGGAVNTIGLEPVKADNYEAGLRGRAFGLVDFEASAYHMTKTDDILSFTRADGSTETVNAGETLHRGIELAAGANAGDALRIDVAWSWMSHEYEAWQPRSDVDYSGNDMEDAPDQVGNIALRYTPAFLRGASVGLEWQRLGEYWMDPANTVRYPGHDLLNLRASVPVLDRVTLFGRVMNLMDDRYAESAGFTSARGEEYAPGMPRSVYIGVEYR